MRIVQLPLGTGPQGNTWFKVDIKHHHGSTQVMVKYFGYIMNDSWLHQKALDIGYPPAKTPEDLDDNISLASINVMAATGVISYARVRRVKTPKGKYFWCIALACDDPFAVGERSLSTHPPPEAKYKALKEALGKDGPPHWYRAI
ncbi:hypothetical protein BD769DRAFT_1669741 [Suillus cothurnatus]|nr:hypothetical protein BD769DRAFT_1669741 [Suillus cothurnatus]